MLYMYITYIYGDPPMLRILLHMKHWSIFWISVFPKLYIYIYAHMHIYYVYIVVKTREFCKDKVLNIVNVEL